MSVQAMAWAIEQQDVTEAHARHVLLCLANYADKEGRAAFPSVSSLSQDTGLAPRTVQYRLRQLESAGLISKGNQAVAFAYIAHKDRVPVCYDLSISRGAQHAPGARQDVPGCTPEHDGVHDTTQRGAQHAPKPSSNHPSTTLNQYMVDFERFWKLYPKKVQKKDAVKAWAKLSPSPVLVEVMLPSLAKQAVSEAWTKNGGQYVPNPATWLNGERWDDEVKPGANSQGKASAYTGLPKHTPEMYQDLEAGDGAPF